MEVGITAPGSDGPSSPGTHSLMVLSDEVLLHILSYVPCRDLVVSVGKVNQKLRTLSLDRSLMAEVRLSGAYQVTDQDLREILECGRREIRTLDLGGCYWLSAPALDGIGRCSSLARLDVTGCPLSAQRLARILAGAPALAALAIDVRLGFDAALLGAEAQTVLTRLTELRQTLLTPSYGVLPYCAALDSLLLRLEIPDQDEGGGALPPAQLLVLQSTVLCYRHLRVLALRLAPGFANQDVARIYLSSLPTRAPAGLETLVLSVPCGFPEMTPWMSQFVSAVAASDDLRALQLPRSWLAEGSSLRSARLRRPRHLILPRCPLRSVELARMLALSTPDLSDDRGGGDDNDDDCQDNDGDDDGGDADELCPARSLATLNLSGLAFGRFGARRPEQASADFLCRLARECHRGLRALNLAGAHAHVPLSPPAPGRLCAALSRLRRLRSLALPLCAVSSGAAAGGWGPPGGCRAPGWRGACPREGGDAPGSAGPSTAPATPGRGFNKIARVARTEFAATAAEQPLQPPPGAGSGRPEGAGSGRPEGAGSGRPEGAGSGRPEGAGSGRPEGAGSGRPEGAGSGRPEGAGPFAVLVSRLPQLVELELVSSNFVSALPRFEMANQQVRHCGHGTAFGDAEMALIGRLPNLRRLTVAQAPEVVTGSGIVALAQGCRNLQELSLANIGKRAHPTYLPALCQALALCQRLRSFRLEQPYVSAGAMLFRALLRCTELERLCVVTHGGALPEPELARHLVAVAPHLVVCHLFTGDTRVACKELQKAIAKSASPGRPALSVAIFPLMHDRLGDVIRSLPLSHLDGFTLFRSHVAQEPPGLWD